MSRKKRNNNKDEESRLPQEVRRAITVVAFFASAALFFLSLTNNAGTLGRYINKFLHALFGWGSWLFPVVLIIIGLILLKKRERKWRIIKITATIILALVYSALFTMRLPQEEVFNYIKQGMGGGYAGLVLYYPLIKITGTVAVFVVLTALGIIALLLVFESRLFQLGRAVLWLLSRLPLGGIANRVKEKLNIEPQYVEPLQGESPHKTVAPLEEPKKQEFKKRAVEEKKEEATSYKQELSTSLKSKYRRTIEIPLNFLDKRGEAPSSGDIAANKDRIKQALLNFGISVEMGATSTGPTVTQYTLKPQEGVKISQIVSLHNDLALALAAHPIRIEAPIPGQSLVGIEVPNKVIATVGLREVLQSKAFRESRMSNLTLAIGKDVSGAPFIADLERMPHLLIAGATGSGKSVAINGIVLSLLYQNSPDDLKMILIDPKRVELSHYNDIPHLLTPVIVEAKKTINALKWAVVEMEKRYMTLADSGDRNIEGYNRTHEEHMPYIIIVIDELADLMTIAAKEVEALIVRLAQMARAVGIHLILATQRPSVNVITGLIKANITARIAFAVASQIDSRTILDTAGADKLLGRGDMLFVTADMSSPKRLQGVYVDEKEIRRVVDFLKDEACPDYLDEVTEKKAAFSMPGIADLEEGFSLNDGDPLLDEARDLIIRAGKASASYLQRHLRIGYARAARILDLLEAEGVIGPVDGAKPRDVLVKQ